MTHAKLIGSVPLKDLKQRMLRPKRVERPLTVKVGTILAKAVANKAIADKRD
jgi:hypothetical protein